MTSFIKKKDIKSALEFLNNFPNSTKILSGCTDLLTNIKELERFNYLLDISNLEELSFITQENDKKIRIGALTTFSKIIKSPLLQEKVPILVSASSQIGSPQIRNRATIGGNIVNASPAGDSIPPLFVLDAILVCQSILEKREIPISEFFTDVRKTVLRPNEIVTEIFIPITQGKKISFFEKIGQRKAQAISKVSVAFNAFLENNRLKNVKIALGAVAPTVIYAKKTQNFLEGKILTKDIILSASKLAKEEASPIDDIRSTQIYRSQMVENLIIKGLI